MSRLNSPSPRAFALRRGGLCSGHPSVDAAFKAVPAPPRWQTIATFSVSRNESGPPASYASAAC